MLLLLLAYLGGALTLLSPCILPVLPFVFARADRPFLRSTLPLLLGMALTFTVVASLAAVGSQWVAQANQIDPQLPRALLLALQPPTAPRLGDARDHAPHRAALPAATPPLREPVPWLLLAIVLLFALERWMASSAQRRVSA